MTPNERARVMTETIMDMTGGVFTDWERIQSYVESELHELIGGVAHVGGDYGNEPVDLEELRQAGVVVLRRQLADSQAEIRQLKAIEQEVQEIVNEVASVLMLMDGLAEQWGDEGVFRRCRDRLRALVDDGCRSAQEGEHGHEHIHRGAP